MSSTSNYLPVRSEWLASGTEAALEPAMPIIDAHHHFYERPGWTLPAQRVSSGCAIRAQR